jgi:hypothetical protein
VANIRSLMKKAAFACAWLLLVGACDDVTADRIQQWKNTEKGPGKLEAAVKQSGLSPELRAQAAVALMEIGRPEAVDAALGGMSDGDRQAFGAAAIPRYAEVINGGGTHAVDARDALFDLRLHAPPAEQRQIDVVLLPSVARDLRAGRYAGGRHAIDKILSAMGPAPGPMLVQLLEEPAAPYPAIVDVLAKLDDVGVRERAGRALVARASKLPKAPPQLLRALGTLGGKSANEFLEARVEKAPPDEAVEAAAALQKGPRDPALVPFALRVASDFGANKLVRDQMFGVLEHVGGMEAVAGLAKIIAGDPEERARYAAFASAVEVGKQAAVPVALEAFPAKASYKPDDVADFLVKEITKLGPSARPALVQLLSSSSTLARLTAVQALQTVGSAAEAPAVKALASDRGTLKGFPATITVGSEASRVAAALAAKTSGKP